MRGELLFRLQDCSNEKRQSDGRMYLLITKTGIAERLLVNQNLVRSSPAQTDLLDWACAKTEYPD